MSKSRPSIRFERGREKRLRTGHPWAFSNELALDAAVKELEPGALVTLTDPGGGPLGVATFNRHSLIAARLLSTDAVEAVDTVFFEKRLTQALALRERLFDAPFYRLIHSEADLLPGLIVDRFGDVVTCQANTAGMERLLEPLLEALDKVLAPRAVVLRNDSSVRSFEGLEPYVRVVKGQLDGPVELVENGVTYLADPLAGQKTGWFYDQRDNRAFVARLSRGARVLDLYSYIGSFALCAAKAGADSVLGIDRSEPAVELAAQAAARNNLSGACKFRRGEVFAECERMASAGERFDVVVADPPAFVKSKKDLNVGARGYRKLARMAAGLVKPGGFLFIASCSHNMDAEGFAEQVRGGLAAAGRQGRILRSAGAAPDHPVHPFLPESAYLKSLTLQLD